MRRVVYTGLAALGTALATSSCTSILGSFEFGTGGSSSSTTSTGSKGSGGSATCTPCSVPENCAMPTGECSIAACTDSCCGVTDLGAGVGCSDTSGGSRCDGKGNCVACLVPGNCPAPSSTCATATCSAEGACGTSNVSSGTACDDNGGKKCDGDGNCVACVEGDDCQATGTACITPVCTAGTCKTIDSVSGTTCTDSGGTVCNGTGTCVACLTTTDCTPSKTKCATIACASNACVPTFASAGTSCSDNGGTTCDGNGKCLPTSCTDGVQDGTETDVDCGGSTCPACMNTKDCKIATDCESGYCDALVCTACTADAQCASGNYCDSSTNGGTCKPTNITATPCTAADQCTSGFCANGFCCNEACTGTCQGCAQALTGSANGVCSNYTAATPAPAGQCSGGTQCGNDGNCAAGGVCEEMAGTISCGSPSCSGSTLTAPGHCNGAGTCNTGASSPCPGNFICGSLTQCLTGCGAAGPSGDANCVAGYYCDGIGAGSCKPQGSLGGACTASDECGTGFCVDGVCCNSACNATCDTCDLSPPGVGTCGTEPNDSNNANHPCASGGVCCSGGCANTQTDLSDCGSCGHACPTPSTLCVIPSCSGGVCETANAPMGTACSDSGGAVCNGSGTCVGCNTTADCSGGGICCGNVCTSNDANNCGACGHGCLGGGCSGQQCQPILLTGGQSGAYGIAVDATNVYWVDQGTGTNGAIMKCAINNCAGTVTALASGLSTPAFMTVDATNTYWTSVAGVMKCAIAGCSNTPTTLCSTTNCQGQTPIVVNSAGVYWPKLIGSPTSLVMTCALTGCGTTPTTLVSGQNDPYGMAIDATNLYWVNTGTGTGGDGTVMKCTLGNCLSTAMAVASGLTEPYFLAVNSTSLFWTYEGGGGSLSNLSKCAIGGGGVTNLVPAASGSDANAVVADGTNVYWTDTGTKQINRMPISGGTVTPLATNQGNALVMTQDAVSIYWTDYVGAVWRLAK